MTGDGRDYYAPVFVPERYREAVEAFVADLEAMERYDADHRP